MSLPVPHLRSRLGVVALALGLAARGASSTQPTLDELLSSVVEAGQGRGVEGRLSGAWPYAPYDDSAGAGLPGPSDPGFVAFVRTAAEIRSRASSERSADNLRALGVLELLWSNEDSAVALLEEARGLDPESARVQNDLGVALLHRAAQPGRAIDLLRAFAVLDQADVRQPRDEIRFNVALTLERLMLHRQAEAAFRRYLQIDPASPWSDEARARQRRLDALATYDDWEGLREALEGDQPDERWVELAVTRFPQQARDLSETELLTRWARQQREGDGAAAEATLELVRRLGAALARTTGDRFVAEAAAAIDDALASDGDGRLQEIVAGQLRFGQGVASFRESRIEDAQRAFEDAEIRLVEGGTPMALSASVRLAFCQNFVGDYAGTLARASRLKRALTGRGFSSLLGGTYWNEGFAHLEQARPSASLESFHAALELFSANGDAANAAFLQLLIANNLEFLGRGTEAWGPRLQALEVAPISNPRQRRTMYSEASKMAWEEGFSRVAALYLDEALADAELLGNARDLAESFWRRAVIDLRLGLRERAEADIERAKLHWSGITDPHVRRRVLGNILLAEAEVALTANPGRAITLLTEALPDFRSTGTDYFLPGIYLARARAHAALGDSASAEADLEAAIDELESSRASIASPGFRSSYLSGVDEIYAEAVRLQAARPDPEGALHLAERRRARTLLDREAGPESSAGAAAPLDADALRSRLPDDVALVEYFVDDEASLAWVVLRDHVEMVELPASRRELRGLARRLEAVLVTSPSSEYVEPAADLYDLVIRPLRAYLPEAVPVVLVPDDALRGVPFAALVDRETGRHLLEERVLLVSPSASVFAAASRAQARPSEEDVDVLVVADPAFDRGEHARLPRLPGAVRTGREILKVYEKGRLMSGSEATRTSFLRWAPRHTIVHFGGHTLISEERPSMSQLVLAAETESPEPLFAGHIAEQRFEKTRLLLLAACRSAGDPLESPEGVGALGQAFLAAGVPTVIASLWDVDDDLAGPLFLRVHRRIQEGVDSAVALREAQLELLRGESAAGARAWATFVHVGPSYRPPKPKSLGSPRERKES